MSQHTLPEFCLYYNGLEDPQLGVQAMCANDIGHPISKSNLEIRYITGFHHELKTIGLALVSLDAPQICHNNLEEKLILCHMQGPCWDAVKI
jgi:hypothetical protein